MARYEQDRPEVSRAVGGAARSGDRVVRRTDVPAPPVDCPACGLPGDRVVVHCKDGSIWTASYLDSLDHSWLVKWAA